MNEQNLKPFTSENQPPGYKKSRKGIPNRATVFKRLLKLKIQVADPSDPKHKTMEVPLYEAAALGQIKAAMNGNANAWKEIQDTLHGKVADKQEIEHSGEMNINHTGEIAFAKAAEKIYGDGADTNN